MLIRAGYEISLSCDHETSLMALLSIHPSRANDLRTPAIITSTHRSPLRAALDEFGNLRTRTVAGTANPIVPLLSPGLYSETRHAAIRACKPSSTTCTSV